MTALEALVVDVYTQLSAIGYSAGIHGRSVGRQSRRWTKDIME